MVNGFKSLFCLETFTIPILVYAFTKLAIPINKETNSFIQTQIYLLRFILTIILTPVVCILIFLFALYFELVKCIAKHKYGDAYYEVLGGADAIWSGNSPECNSIIQVLYLCENQPETSEKMKHIFTDPEFQAKILKNHPRLSCIKKYLLGYCYYVKIQVDYTKVVRYFDDYNTLEEFHEVINEVTASRLPYNDEFMWEVLIGRKAVQFETGKWLIPVLTRFHHSVSDGIGLSMFMLTTYSKNGMQRFKDECKRYDTCFPKKVKQKKTLDLTGFIEMCKRVLRYDIYYHYDMIRTNEPESVLHKKMSGEKVVRYSFEVEGDNLIQKIKKTKRALKVSFADVLLSAIGAAFAEYYEEYDKTPPKYITSGNPFYLKTGDLESLVTVNKDGEPVTNLGNKFVLGLIELPTDSNLLQNPIKIVNKVHETSEHMKHSMDFAMIYWMFNIFVSVVPLPIAMMSSRCFDSSVIITNVPGVMSLRYRNDCKVEDMMVWTQNYNRTGVTVTFFTYNDLMRVTVHVDKNLVEDVKGIQKLSDNILRYISVIHDDTFSNTNNNNQD